MLIISTDVNYGVLTVNGKEVPFQPNDPDHTVALSPSLNVLTLTASPFRSITCRIENAPGGIPLGTGQCQSTGSASSGNSERSSILNMNFMLADLPIDQQQAFLLTLHHEINQMSSMQVTVHAGDHYAAGIDAQSIPQAVLAQAPLHAQTMVSISPKDNNGMCIDGICPGEMLSPLSTPVPSYYAVSFKADISWHFVKMNGAPVATYIPPPINDQMIPPGEPMRLYFNYDPANGWQTIQGMNARILPTNDLLSQMAINLCNHSFDIVSLLSTNGGGLAYRNEPALEGCLFVMNGTGGMVRSDFDPRTDTQNAWILVHFWAALAANDKAHSLFPQFPRATANEIAAIRQRQPALP